MHLSGVRIIETEIANCVFARNCRTHTIRSRSPMAEAVLKHQISQRASLKERFNVEVDSAGTGAYHEGDDADER